MPSETGAAGVAASGVGAAGAGASGAGASGVAASGAGAERPRRVGDLVAALPVRTVVQMADLRDPALRRRLGEEFVPTADAAHALRTVLADVAAGAGRGYFVEGNYGAGKSHLLAALHLALGGELPALPGSRGTLRRVLAVPVSLVEHAAEEPLERIVLSHVAEVLAGAAGRDVASGYVPGGLGRREVWRRRAAQLADAGYGGLALLVDELSEFLRSKPDGRALNEDVRFLQFLGEAAERLPAWIVCSTQEAIEVAADVPPQIFAKIKDRYPVRFRLGEAHVKELIGRRLVRQREGAEPALRQVYGGLCRAFGGLPFTWEAFLALYPLHPATVELLDELRPLFSQHRGVVDFIRARLAGDPARRIPAFLDQPADRLLCPDAIWDHFRDRVRELPETSRVATVAVPYLEQEAHRMLADPEAAALALRAVRLLALGAVCPTPRSWSIGDLADRLLHRLTDLDPELNLDFLREALDRLVAGGAYLVRAGDRYRLDAQADVGLVVRRRAEHVFAGLLPDDGRLFRELAGWCDDPLIPLARLCAQTRSLHEVRWMGGARRVAVWCARAAELDGHDAREWVQQLQSGEPDVGLLVAQAYPGEADASRHRWERVLRPALVQAAGREPVMAWLPREATAEERVQLRRSLALALVEAELAGDRSETGRRVRRHLAEVLPVHRRRTAEIYRALYLDGQVVGCDGARAFPAAVGAGSFATLLERLADAPLRARFPRHPEVAVRTDLVTPATLERALDLLAGEGELRTAGDAGLQAAVERVLVPLGLASRTPRGYRLQVDAGRCPLAGELLSAVGPARPAAPARLDDLCRRLRKGPYGLPRQSFDVLALALVRAGALSGCRSGRRVPGARVTAASLWDLDGVVGGERLSPGAQEMIGDLPFLPDRVRRAPFAPVVQRGVWQAIVAWRNDWAGVLDELERRLAEVRDLPGLRPLWGAVAAEGFGRVRAWVAAVRVASPPHEGIQRFLAAWGARPAAADGLARAERLRRFLTDRVDLFLFMAGYLGVPDPPAVPELAAERERLAALAGDPRAVLGDAGWQRLSEGFALFRETHAAAYAAAHDATVGRAGLSPYEALRATDAYAVAACLGAIPGLAVGHDRVELDRRLDLALAAACGRDHGEVAALLQRLPACPCGFRPDAPPDREPLEALRSACERSARAYLEALRRPDWAERLRACAGGLSAVGREREAVPLEDLLRLDPGAPDAVERAAKLLTGSTGRDLVAALTVRTPIVRRDLADLHAALGGRAFERGQLLAAVEAWLGRTPPGSYVRVTSGAAARPGGERRGGAPAEGGSTVQGGERRGGAPGDGDGGVLSGAGTRAASDVRPAMPAEDPREALARLAAVRADPVALAAVEAAAPDGPVRLAARGLQALDALRATAARPPADGPGWERAYAAYAQGERLLAEARDAIRQAGLTCAAPVAHWQAEWNQAAGPVRAAFRAYHGGLAQSAPPHVRTLGQLYTAWSTRRDAPGDAAARFWWCLDALRADLLPPLMAALGADAERLSGGVLWAVVPTVTAMQFDALRAAGFRGPSIPWGDDQVDAVLADPACLAEVDWACGGESVCRLAFLDDRVHAGRDDYAAFVAEFRLQVRRRLVPAFRALPGGALVLVFGDHGFVENPSFPGGDRHATPRYVHGGVSPEEVLAPWVVLRRRASTPGPGRHISLNG